VAYLYRVLTGPTAAGKTAWLLNLAQNSQLNVISADSRQVYRNMDLGTGKPPLTDLEILPHYVIDLLEPGIFFSVYQYLIEAAKGLAATRAQGREAWICGGTGLYIRALTERLSLGLPPRPMLRQALQALLGSLPAPELTARLGLTLSEDHNPVRVIRRAELACADPQAAARIYAVAGLDLDLSAGDVAAEQGLPQSAARELAQWECGGVAVLDPGKEELLLLIEHRVHGMFRDGLVDEVAQLRRLGYGAAQVVAQGIGYREAGQVLDGVLNEAEAEAQTVIRTRQYAKRQRTLFRGMGWPSMTREALGGYFASRR
jgi:tRNA dimethylallyltransferase